MDRIAIILPVHNRKDDTLTCLKQLQDIKTEGFRFEIVIIDDGSTDGTSEAVTEAYPDVTILQGDGNLWWAGGINTGFEYVLEKGHEFVYTTNDDIEYASDTLQVLYDTLKENRNAVCCSTFLNKSKEDFVVYAGFRMHGFFKRLRSPLRGPYLESYAGQIVEADTLSTKSTLIPTGIIRDVGYFDAKHFPHNYSDFNFFERVKKKGYKLLVNMDSRIYTEGSDVSYHQLLLNKSLRDIAKTFFDKKYGNHWKTVYNRATVGEGFVRGHLILIGKILPYLYWLLLRIFLPASTLKKIMIRKGRSISG
jgi:GT2 family glycosyltransferase